MALSKPVLLANETCSNDSCPEGFRRSATYARLPPMQCNPQDIPGPITLFESKCQGAIQSVFYYPPFEHPDFSPPFEHPDFSPPFEHPDFSPPFEHPD
jgi:hypothetical protein